MSTRRGPFANLVFVRELVRRVTPPADRVFVVTEENRQVFLYVDGYVRDLADPDSGLVGVRSWQRGARQWISSTASESDIFRLMLSMLIAFEEHEIREAFLVDGVRVFGPHITIEALKDAAEQVEA